jgi:hypothetical protein
MYSYLHMYMYIYTTSGPYWRWRLSFTYLGGYLSSTSRGGGNNSKRDIWCVLNLTFLLWHEYIHKPDLDDIFVVCIQIYIDTLYVYKCIYKYVFFRCVLVDRIFYNYAPDSLKPRCQPSLNVIVWHKVNDINLTSKMMYTL